MKKGAEDWSEFLQEHSKPQIPADLFQWPKKGHFAGLQKRNKTHRLQSSALVLR